MSNEKRIKVFISSTSFDLPDHRKIVIEALNFLNFQPIGMEYWAVTGEDPLILCERNVKTSDAFIGIYAHRYGWCPNNYGGKSITELEYDWAETVTSDGKQIPRFCFVMDETHPITIGMVESEKKTAMEAFKKRVSEGHQIGFFRSVDDLKAQVIQTLANWSIEKHKVAKENNKDLPNSSATKTKRRASKDVIAYRIDSGTVLVNLIAGSHMRHFNNDELLTHVEVELVGNFLQNIGDYGDLWDDLGPYDHTKTGFEMQRELQELDSNGFLVYGCQQNQLYRFGIGEHEQTMETQTLYPDC
ncbi:MAG: DUF4062 domain-containing protein [Chloroflexota bacterium]